jgi:group I intron endonuclease
MYAIYKITCHETGKFYIGKTCQSLNKRWIHHVCYANQGEETHFKRAIRLYGKDKFTREEIAWAADNEKANWLEKHFIAFLSSNNPEIGYNSTPGGDGISKHTPETLEKLRVAGRRLRHTPEAKAKISEALRARVYSEETRKKMSESRKSVAAFKRSLLPPKPPKTKRVFSEETKAKISASLVGLRRGIKLTEEHRKRISLGLVGHDCSEETRRKIGLANAGHSRPQSEETRRKISEGLRGIRRSEETRHRLKLARQRIKEKKMANKGDKQRGDENSLVPLSAPELDTYRVKGSDFPFTFKTPEDSSGGSQGAGLEQQDKLMPLSDFQEHPRYAGDDGEGVSGAGTPSVWGEAGKTFSIEKNKGEGDMAATAVSIAEGVDLIGGQITCKGYKETPKGEVAEATVSIGRH